MPSYQSINFTNTFVLKFPTVTFANKMITHISYFLTHNPTFRPIRGSTTNYRNPTYYFRCDADPAALAKYVLALVKKDKSEFELRKSMKAQLQVFLEGGKPKNIASYF